MNKRLNKLKIALVAGTVLGLFAARIVFATKYFVNMTLSYTFDPPSLTIEVGDTVTWFNQDIEDHTSTSDSGSTDPWDSGDVHSGDSWPRQFNSPGTFNYHCIYHFNQGMTGTITVNSVVPPTLSSPMRPNNSQFQFTISGTVGQTYIIETSGNLANWVAIATNVAPSNVFNYTNTSATNLTHFYRVKQGL